MQHPAYLLRRAITVYREEGWYWLKKKTKVKLRRTLVDLFGQVPGIDKLTLHFSKKRLMEHMRQENSLEDVLDSAYGYSGYGLYRSIRPFLTRTEITGVLKAIDREQIETVLEIGTARGGSLYIWSRALNPSTIVSVDRNHLDAQIPWFEYFTPDDVTLVAGDSHSTDTYQFVKDSLSESGGVDLLFLDGDHTYSGVKRDYEIYGDLVSENGVIVFDDIATRGKSGISVCKFWAELREEEPDERFQEFIDGEKSSGGIGLYFPSR